MKKSILTTHIVLLAMLSMVFLSCKEDGDLNAPPKLDRVRVLSKDSTATSGMRGTWYSMQGLHLATTYKVTVNDLDAYINPALITDQNIVFSIPVNAPYLNVLDKIKVITKYGEALIDFKVVVPPPPIITSVAPLNVNPGDTVTIVGLNLTSAGPGDVKFGNTVAEVVPGSTNTQMKIKVPAGERFGRISITGNNQTAITNETISVIKLYYYRDALAGYTSWGCWNGGFGNGGVAPGSSADTTRQGNSGLRFAYTLTGGTYQHGMWGIAAVPLFSAVGAQFFKMSVYVNMNPTDELRFQIRAKNSAGTLSPAVFSEVVKGRQWTEVIIPLSSFSNPDKFTELQITQAAPTGSSIPNAGVNTVYFDEIGVL
jgi:hypothetical protein